MGLQMIGASFLPEEHPASLPACDCGATCQGQMRAMPSLPVCACKKLNEGVRPASLLQPEVGSRLTKRRRRLQAALSASGPLSPGEELSSASLG